MKSVEDFRHCKGLFVSLRSAKNRIFVPGRGLEIPLRTIYLDQERRRELSVQLLNTKFEKKICKRKDRFSMFINGCLLDAFWRQIGGGHILGHEGLIEYLLFIFFQQFNFI